VRIIAATNKDLDAMMARNQFRKDLYYRLSGGWIHLPPLRDRMEDIPLLIESFIKEFRGNEKVEIAEEVMDQLMIYDYPGNIRELRSIIKSAVTLAQGRPVNPGCLPVHIQRNNNGWKSGKQTTHSVVPTLAAVEKAHILKVYRMLNSNKAEAARLLGIGINTLRRKLNQYNIQ